MQAGLDFTDSQAVCYVSSSRFGASFTRGPEVTDSLGFAVYDCGFLYDLESRYGYNTLTPNIQRDFPRGSASSVDGYAGVNSSIDVPGCRDCQCTL